MVLIKENVIVGSKAPHINRPLIISVALVNTGISFCLKIIVIVSSKAPHINRPLIIGVALVNTGISLSSRINLHLGLEPFLSFIPFTYMKIVMVIQFSSILEPDDFGPGFSRGHAN